MAVNEKTWQTQNMQKNLKTLRELAGLSAAQLAEEINVTKQTIHRFEALEKPQKTDMTYCQYRTIRLVFEEIIQSKLEKDPNDTDLQGAIKLLIDNADKFNEDEYAETQSAVKMVSASKKAGVDGAFLKKIIPGVVSTILGAVIIGLLTEDDLTKDVTKNIAKNLRKR